MNEIIKLVECPRDAMQGWPTFIPTTQKIDYLNQLLKVGFDVLDCGSFVSPKAIPQLADTREVLAGLDLNSTSTQLLTIIANTRGAQEAVAHEKVSFIGFPFSISETFQLRNTNKTIAESLVEVEAIQKLCIANKKELVIYISMGFGNPYGDEYNADIVEHWVRKLSELGIRIFALSDTVGMSNKANISYIFQHLIAGFPHLEIGAHFHTLPQEWEEKITSAWENGCRRFDSAIKGFGGCPMAGNHLVGNMDTLNLNNWIKHKNFPQKLNQEELVNAAIMTAKVFI